MHFFRLISRTPLSDAVHFAVLHFSLFTGNPIDVYSQASVYTNLRASSWFVTRSLRDKIRISLEEFLVNVLAPYLSLLCPPIYPAVYLHRFRISANMEISWCIFPSNVMRMDLISETSYVYPPPPREESIYLSLFPPYLCNKGVLPDTSFLFPIFGASVISGKPEELHLPWCCTGIAWTVFQMLTCSPHGSIYLLIKSHVLIFSVVPSKLAIWEHVLEMDIYSLVFCLEKTGARIGFSKLLGLSHE